VWLNCLLASICERRGDFNEAQVTQTLADIASKKLGLPVRVRAAGIGGNGS
jgi:hypothetical protein